MKFHITSREFGAKPVPCEVTAEKVTLHRAKEVASEYGTVLILMNDDYEPLADIHPTKVVWKNTNGIVTMLSTMDRRRLKRKNFLSLANWLQEIGIDADTKSVGESMDLLFPKK